MEKFKGTSGEWEISNPTFTSYTIHTKDMTICDVLCIDISDEEALANAKLIAAAPELLQMVYDLMKCIERLTTDEALTQLDKDTEAEWIGEAHELLLKANGCAYWKNANEK